MMSFKDNEAVEEEVVEEYDYTNEEPFKEESSFEYEEDENEYCD